MKKLLLIAFLSIVGTMAQAEELNGLEITYKLSNGQIYNIEFGEDELSYRFLSGNKPEKLWGLYSYKASQTTNGEHFIAWYEEGYYATILVNQQSKSVHSSSISGKRTWFLQGELSEAKK